MGDTGSTLILHRGIPGAWRNPTTPLAPDPWDRYATPVMLYLEVLGIWGWVIAGDGGVYNIRWYGHGSWLWIYD